MTNQIRHPELVSGSISPLVPSVCAARWMLKQVQHDVWGNAPFYRRHPSAGWGLSRLSAIWFAQRHEGIKKLRPVFVSSCELKTYRARKYKTMGSRFRGNDNVGFMASVCRYSRRPSVGWGLSRLSFEHGVNRPSAIGSSLRWSDGVLGERVSPPVPSVSLARWMLKQVQHDVGGNAPFYRRRPSAGWGLSRLSEKWFAQRHEEIKKLLPVFASSCEPKSCRARKHETMGSRLRGNDNVWILGLSL
jgi:hypothetical protein